MMGLVSCKAAHINNETPVSSRSSQPDDVGRTGLEGTPMASSMAEMRIANMWYHMVCGTSNNKAP